MLSLQGSCPKGGSPADLCRLSVFRMADSRRSGRSHVRAATDLHGDDAPRRVHLEVVFKQRHYVSGNAARSMATGTASASRTRVIPTTACTVPATTLSGYSDLDSSGVASRRPAAS